MSWYYGTYSCGHEGRINIVGPQKDRQSKADWRFSGLCPECLEKERKDAQERANTEAEKRSEEMEWPILTGTEKQVAWANTLRLALFEKFCKNIQKIDEAKLSGMKLDFGGEIRTITTSKDELTDSFDYAILSHTDASFWINNRDNSKIFFVLFKEYICHKEEQEI